MQNQPEAKPDLGMQDAAEMGAGDWPALETSSEGQIEQDIEAPGDAGSDRAERRAEVGNHGAAQGRSASRAVEGRSGRSLRTEGTMTRHPKVF